MTTTSTTARAIKKGWLATALADQLTLADEGEQRQTFVHAGSHAGVTARWILMPPGHAALMHAHADSVIVVSVVRGNVTSVLVDGDQLVTEDHQPGGVIIIDRRWLHIGVNVSTTDPVVLFEVGTSEHFHTDVVRHEEWDRGAEHLGRELQQRHTPTGDRELTVADILIEHLLPEYQRGGR